MSRKTRTPIRRLMNCSSLVAVTLATPALAQNVDTTAAQRMVERLDARGAYLTGDKHNHTTCTDGTTSVRTLVDQSTITYGLDWFAQTGHGGSGNRDCRFDDIQTGNFFEPGNPQYDAGEILENDFRLRPSNPRKLWVESIGEDEILGDDNGDRMWRWQSLIQYAYPDVANAGRISDKTTWLGVETNVPGHEHTSMAILGNQFRRNGDAYSTGQFEYLWDRADNDSSGGEDLNFEDPSNDGVEKNFDNTGFEGHEKAVDSVEWMRRHHKDDSYYVPAHVERQGGFVGDANRGYNVEHLRDFHNAGLFDDADVTGPSLAFGGEFAPGHQFQTNRGSYSLTRPTAGFGTYGGAGAYSAAQISVPGYDFDGQPITDETINALNAEFDEAFGGNPYTGQLGNISGSRPPERYVLGRPGVNTLWDAMLGEGRRYFNFFSSDWHSRGAFGPFEPHSTNDAWPGEYQKIYAYARGGDGGYSQRTANEIVRGMRDGNSFSVMGDLIDSFNFMLCQDGTCATMGEELNVDPSGTPVVWYMRVRDPQGTNNSPYTFDNPSLLQLGINIPVNEPVLDNVDIIRGDITGPISPDEPAYTQNVANPTTAIFETIARDGFEIEGEFMVAAGEIPADFFSNDMYFRVRGTNMPKGTPNETDAEGNPLLDFYANNIACPFPYTDPVTEGELGDVFTEFNPESCPPYLPFNERIGSQVIDFDVESWVDLWFYANPVFVSVSGDVREARGPRPNENANPRALERRAN